MIAGSFAGSVFAAPVISAPVIAGSTFAGSVAAVLALGVLVRPRPVARAASPPVVAGRAAALAVPGSFALLALAGGLAIGWLPALLSVAGWWGARSWRRLASATRLTRQMASAYPDAIDIVVLAVRTGFLPAAALETATPYIASSLRAAFGATTARVAAGERFADALDELVCRLGPMARPLVDSFAAADRYGLPLAPVLERLAVEARMQRRREADAAARQLPVRLSFPLVLCTLPSFVLLAIVPLLIGAFSSLPGQ